VRRSEERIRNGIAGYKWMAQQGGRAGAAVPAELESSMRDVGYSLLLKRIRPDIENATDEEIRKAALSTIPDVPVLFWSFRIMVALGFYFIWLFGVAFYHASRRRYGSPFMLRLKMYSLPLPWVAAELGWIVAEYGRQPWIIDGVMPTFIGVSSVPASNVAASLAAFVIFYTALAVVDLTLIVKYVRIGPNPQPEEIPQAGPLPIPAPAFDASR
jgi:cytochrome d ubiquinol oxidase subunit I